MRKLFYLSTLVLTVLVCSTVSAQDFSNKGKDFWVGYGYHQVMTGGNSQQMVLYFAAEQNSNVTVTIPALGYVQNYFVPAGAVVTSNAIPKIGAQDARLQTEGFHDKGIHITSDKAIVSYAHIYNSNVSGATILYPTNTLGKEYYSINFTNNSNTGNANCWFYVVATDPGTTTIELTPSANTVGGLIAGNTYTFTLTQGQIYNVMGTYAGNSGVDLTGSIIKSIDAGSGCKKIGVFSGSGRIAIVCSGGPTSSDNYMVQAVPKAAWGKKYLTVPTAPSMQNGFYRICIADPTTVVFLNGLPIGVPLIGGFYYEIGPVNTPQTITADKPIAVAQYITSQGACGNGTPGDPEVIYLSPVEQNINRVLWNATPNFAITQHYVNVVIPNTGTALTSFRLDGVPIPPAAFVIHPGDPNYSYLFTGVTAGQHTILSDSGFNAIAYGYGNFESYGYNAGTNIKDLFQFVNIKNTWGTVNFPATCQNTPFRLSMVFPYQPTQIEWIFGPILNGTGIFRDTIILTPVADSSWVVAGRTIYRYRLPTTYWIPAIGVYPIRVIATNPTPDGCGNLQEIDFDLEVFAPPIADFTFTTNGCFNSPVNFFDNSNTSGRPVISRYMAFDDGNSSTILNPTHTYAAPGAYNVKYTLITDVGCLADTVSHLVELDPIPTAQFAVATSPLCINQPVTFNDQSIPLGSSTLAEWTWDFGDGSPVVVRTTSTNEVHTFTTAGTFNVTLRVETTSGCASTLFSLPVTIEPDGTINLSSAPGTDNQTICINTPLATISYLVAGSGTGGTVTGLPAGVTGSFAGGVITITGTPTVAGVFNYTVNTTGPCVNPTATGTITVTPDGTATLSSAPGTDNQTVCINTSITNITYAVGGSGTGGFVAGLPAGVTGSFAGGVITITGTPSVSGTFNYTVTTTGPCFTPGATGTITVTADGTVTLSSAPGTDNQTVCINAPIVNITYTVGGSGTGGSVTGLPAGVTGSFAGGVVTISGTSTVAGVFNYTVNTTGPCVNPSTPGTITVTADGTVTLSSAPGTDNQTVCINAPITNITYNVGGSGTGGSVTGLPTGVNGIFAGGVITIIGSPTLAGVFNYTVNTTGPCLNPTATGTITVTPDGTVTLSSAPGTDNQSVCINVPITNITYAVGGSGTGGSVASLPTGVTGSFAGGVITITGTPTVSGVFNYTVSTTGPCGIPTATGTITVEPDATITLTSPASSANQELCVNATIANITYAVGGTGSGATVSGLPAGVTGSFAGGVFTISGTPSVSGIFNYTVTTTGICAPATATGTITVNALPTADFTTTTPSCETRVISFFDASIPNSGNIISWSWDFGDGSPLSTAQNPTHTYAAAGTYTVTLVVTTDKGCISTTPPRQITINNRPNADYVLPEVCLNDTFAQFLDASSVAPPDVVNQWEWDFGDGTPVSNLQNPTHGYLTTGTFNVRLIVTSNLGCRDTIIQPIFVNGSFPVADFTVQNPATLCANDSVSIAEASTVFPGTITKVEIYWDNVGAPGTFDTDNTPFSGKIYKHKYPTLATTQTYTIRYRAYSGGVCVNDRLRNVTVNAAPDAVFNNMPSICFDAAPWQIPPAIASEIGGVAGAGVFTGPGVSPSGLFNPVVAGIGTHRIMYTYTATVAGCVDTASNLITVWDTASAKIDLLSSLCERTPVGFTSTNSTLPAGNGTINGWTWSFGDPASGPLNTSNAAAPTHLFTGWGNYTVTLSVTTSNGCRSTIRSLPVLVNPIARPDFTFPAISCLPNATVAFTNGSTIPDGTESAFTYLWNFGDPPSGIVNTSTGKDPSHTYVGVGPYNINLEVTSGAGCVHDTMIVLSSIHPQPQASFDTDKIDVCLGGSITFTNRSNPLDGTLTSLNWDLDNGTNRTQPVFTYTYPVVGTYNVSLYIFNSFGCKSNVFVKPVSVNPIPPVNAGPSKFMLEGGQVELTPAVNASYPITYSWSPGRYLNDSTLSNPIARPPDDTYFRLTVTSDKGCSAWDTMFVKVLKKPDIPNIFSPNGDNVNDRWVIRYLDSYPGCTVQLVNRYGQLVFKSVGYTIPWDGKINGTDAPIGTYYYVVDPKNGRLPLTGYVDIIR